MAFTIPAADRASLATLGELALAELDELIAALEEAPPTADMQALAKKIAPAVPFVPVEKLRPILETLSTLYFLRELSGVPRSGFLGDLIDAIQRTPRLRVSESDIPKVRSRLERLLDINTLKMLAKSGRLPRAGE